MNRTGLLIALGIGAAAGLLFGIFPELDLRLAALFYTPADSSFGMKASGIAAFAREAAMWIAWAFAAPAIVALAMKLLFPRKPLLISARAMIFVLLTIFLSAGLLSNLIFKSHWGRPRPVATVEFGGALPFVPWWDARGKCQRNCSFFSGEAATAFWTYAPAALAPPQYRALAYAGATVFGLATGVLRMTFGGHYATDVIFAGVVVFLVVWLAHGMIYRWPRSPGRDDDIDRKFGDSILAMRRELTAPVSEPRISAPSAWWLVAGFAALTLARIVGLKFSVADLFYDEAQYWAWSQAPALGYFSKPPLLAWVIAGAGQLCGSSEACIRAPSPLLYFGTALLTYFTALTLYGRRVAWWSSLCVMLAPGLIFSARIISTDVPLLFCWALALLAFVKLREAPRWGWAAVLGLALGIGLLAKYAMVYFVLGVAVAAFVDPATRALLRGPHPWASLALGLALVAPNLIWVANHDFVTFRHTEDNIAGGGLRLNPLGALEFLGSQFGVFGPVMFAVFLLLLARPRAAAMSVPDRVMIAFALPPLALVALVGLLSKANANWAAPSVISLMIVAVAVLARQQRWRWLYATLALGVVVQGALWIGDARADRMSLSALSNPDIYHRTLGWKSLGEQTAAMAQASGARSVVADQREVLASLIYYLRDGGRAVLSWPTSRVATHQFDIDRPLTPGASEPVLYISGCPWPAPAGARYATVEPLGEIATPTGRHSQRRFYGFRLSGAKAETAPLGACVP